MFARAKADGKIGLDSEYPLSFPNSWEHLLWFSTLKLTETQVKKISNNLAEVLQFQNNYINFTTKIIITQKFNIPL